MQVCLLARPVAGHLLCDVTFHAGLYRLKLASPTFTRRPPLFDESAVRGERLADAILPVRVCYLVEWKCSFDGVVYAGDGQWIALYRHADQLCEAVRRGLDLA